MCEYNPRREANAPPFATASGLCKDVHLALDWIVEDLLSSVNVVARIGGSVVACCGVCSKWVF